MLVKVRQLKGLGKDHDNCTVTGFKLYCFSCVTVGSTTYTHSLPQLYSQAF